ncbi:MAG TPA: hypothetical protein VN688_11465 [Gemmataceae bacterium]|nr:hypothetical protein [Gemmataceae bacterium]
MAIRLTIIDLGQRREWRALNIFKECAGRGVYHLFRQPKLFHHLGRLAAGDDGNHSILTSLSFYVIISTQ